MPVRLLLKHVIFSLLVPGVVAVGLPLTLARGRPVAASPLLLTLGVGLLAVGLATYIRCVWDFAVFGRGTPLPLDAPRRLVVRGLYRYMRNPMYLGVLCVAAAWPAILASSWLLVYAAALALAFQLFVVLHEEPRLRVLYGAEYDAYRRTVPRWLPRPRRWMPG
jgi:protein-S-isoprenylcysteine O-methyltransferase Ste14